MPVPGTYNGWTIYEGSVFGQTVTWPGIPSAAGYSAQMDIRQQQSRESALILSLTVANSRVALSSDGTDLTLTLRITAPDTIDLAFLPAKPGPLAYYDIKITPPSGEDDTWTALQGTIAYDRDTTDVP